MEENRSKEKQDVGRSRWRLYRLLLILIPALIPVAYLLMSRKTSWDLTDMAMVGMIFLFYWLVVFAIALRIFHNKKSLQTINLASPLIEVPLDAELRMRLYAFAATNQQKPAVAAFELLDKEIPRFELDAERDRAIRDNEHLRQQAGQGAFLVAVTTEILKRLLLLSGAQQEDRKDWHSHISETAARIVSDALDHHHQAAAETTS